MKSRIRTRKKSPTEQTPDFSTAPAQPMFQSRSFVVQTRSAQKSQPTDLKTSLRRAERYGHHLSRMLPSVPINGDRALEAEADQLGAKAAKGEAVKVTGAAEAKPVRGSSAGLVQRAVAPIQKASDKKQKRSQQGGKTVDDGSSLSNNDGGEREYEPKAFGIGLPDSGNDQGEHIFNALGNLGQELAQTMRTMIAAEGEQIDKANQAITTLETRARDLIAARDNSHFRSAPPGQGDRVNASRYSNFAQETRRAAENLSGGAASQQSSALRHLTLSREILERNTIDKVAVEAMRKSLGKTRLNDFNTWYDNTRNLMYEVYNLIYEAAWRVARTRAGLPPMSTNDKDSKGKGKGREPGSSAWHKENTAWI